MCKFLCALTAVGLVILVAGSSQSDNEAKAILEKAIKAHGGEKNLAKLMVRQEKTKDTAEFGGQISTRTTDSLVQLPDQRKTTSEFDKGPTLINVINGDKGWFSSGGKTKDYTAETVKFLKERLHEAYVVTLAPLLKDKSFTLSPLGEIKVNDRPVLGLKVCAKDHQDVDLFFDKETGLLVKSQFRQANAQMQEFDMEEFYSDYKEVDGLKWPMRTVRYRDGKKGVEIEITELKFLDKIDASVFDKP